ncbi:hypothetical protein Tsubulata_020858, partial [Turnera subulata]
MEGIGCMLVPKRGRKMACGSMGSHALVMFLVQISTAGTSIVYKMALSEGMSTRVVVAYRLIFGCAFLLPLALLVERKRPKMTWLVLFQIFVLGLVGGPIFHNSYIASLNLTSMTFAMAIFNLTPALTYIVAILFKMETLSVTSARGLAKVIGSAASIGGAMVLTFYKSVEINLWHTNINLLNHHHHPGDHTLKRETSTRDQVLGLALGLMACLLLVSWTILQAKIYNNYPCFYTTTALSSSLGGIQAAAYAICYDRKWSDWKLGWSDHRLIYMLFLGTSAGLNVVAVSWCIAKRGPLFSAIFSPLALLVVAISDYLAFEEKLYLGRDRERWCQRDREGDMAYGSMGSPGLAMFLVQIAFAGINIVYKMAMNDGMSMRVLVAYRLIFGAAFMIPVALVVERNKRPKLTWLVLSQIFLLGLVGMETLSVTNARGLAKVLGTAVCIGGAMVLTFYKGIEINLWHTNINLLNIHHGRHHIHREPSTRDQVLGLALALIACVLYAFWMILQAKINANYPCFYSSTALMSSMGAIQATLYAICFDRKWSDWKLGWSDRLIYALYLGVFASGLNIAVMAWCISKRGPLFAAIFNPLMLLVVALSGSLVFNEKLHLGSVLGGILIIGGLYTVLWGKSKDLMKKNIQQPPPKSLEDSVPAKIVVPLQADDDKGNE